MIQVALILVAVVFELSIFWDNLVSFVKDTLQKAKKIVDGILYGTKVFLQKIGSAIKEIARHYSQVGNKWKENTYERYVSPSEVPQEFLEKAERAARQNKAADISKALEMKLTT